MDTEIDESSATDSTEHTTNNSDSESILSEDISPVRGTRHTVAEKSADLSFSSQSPSPVRSKREFTRTRRHQRKQCDGGSVRSIPGRITRNTRQLTMNYEETDEETDEENGASNDEVHVSISSRGRIRKPTTRAISNIFY